MQMLDSGIRPICGYDLDSNRLLIPDHVRSLRGRSRQEWFRTNQIVPAIEGAAYSNFEMAQPWKSLDGTAVTAAAETVLTADSILTLPANFWAYPGKSLWFRAMGKQSNVITTPGTYTFRLRYNAIGGAILVASGAITPESAAGRTDMMWKVDIFIKALVTGEKATDLTLLAYGEVFFANTLGTAADIRAGGMPAGGVALANVTGLDGTTPKAMTLTVQPTVATGSITCRDAWLVAMN